MIGVLFFGSEAYSKGFPIHYESLVLPNPPAENSIEDRADFKKLFEIQSIRDRSEESSKAYCLSVFKQQFPTVNGLFGPFTGALQESQIKSIQAFGDQILDTVSKACEPFKKNFKRSRPFNRDPSIKICSNIIAPKGESSYPSSHAAMGITLGVILAKLFPEQQEQLIKAAFNVGENRLIAGVHHPSDVKAGRELSKQILKELSLNSEFLEAFNLINHSIHSNLAIRSNSDKGFIFEEALVDRFMNGH